jgi:hypothetical protein
MSSNSVEEFVIRPWKVVAHRDPTTPKDVLTAILLDVFHLLPEHARLFADVIGAKELGDGGDEERRVQFGPFSREVAEHLAAVALALAAHAGSEFRTTCELY